MEEGKWYYTGGNPKTEIYPMATRCRRLQDQKPQEIISLSGVLATTVQPCRARVRIVYIQSSGKSGTHGFKPVSKGNNMGIRLIWVIEERSVTGVRPESKDEVAEVGVHEGPELPPVDVLVHSTM